MEEMDRHKNKILQGDSLHVLRELPESSVDLVCTDPPYGYSFMGKDWDKAVPSVEVWKECLRVLKPGAFAFVMSAPRQDVLSQMIVRIGEAGFKTDFTSIYWTYASGFPKAMNIGKKIDTRLGLKGEVIGTKKVVDVQSNGSVGDLYQKENSLPMKDIEITKRVDDNAKKFDGSYGGFQPKPAVEVIIVAMKPLSEKTYVDQALKNGKGITWLDDCRIPAASEKDLELARSERKSERTGNDQVATSGNRSDRSGMTGRFPANLLCSDDVLNDGVERKVGKLKSTFQSGNGYGFQGQTGLQYSGDSGSYSRYFDLDKWAQTLPFLIVPKASKSEKNKGGIDCTHPTVKPLKLMSYLITLGSREGDLVLDPFVGSGTTCLAAKNLNRNYIGIEREAEYVAIAEARLQEIQPILK